MSNFPCVKAKDLSKSSKISVFILTVKRGSHAIYKDSHGQRVVVPIHSGKDLKQGTLRGLI